MTAQLSATLSEAASRFGDRPALAAGSCVVSYRDLDRIGHEVGAWLAGLGRRRESPIEPDAAPVVAVMLPPVPEHHALLAGAARAGWVVAGINRRLSAHQRSDALAVIDPDLLVTTPDCATDGRWEQLLVEPAEAAEDLLAEARRQGARAPETTHHPDRPTVIVLTSGTTGVPKGAVFADRQLRLIRATDVGDTWGGGGATLMATELVHIGAMTKFAGALQSGATTHMLPHWHAGPALDLVERERMAVVGGISAQVALMVRDPSVPDRDLRCVQLVVAGGGASSPELIREATRVFGAPYAVRYSATESGGLGCAATFNGDEPDEVLGTVGLPRDGFAVRVGDRPDEPLSNGETGRVWLRSPAQMDRWWGRPDLTAETIVDGWLAMGDHGRLDDEGRLALVGRIDDGWVRGGYNVHPHPIEHVLRQHPDVDEVAVVARPDPVMGHVGVAVVVAYGAAGIEEALLDHARARLARHEVPVEVVEVDALPMTPLHKVDRRALRERVAR